MRTTRNTHGHRDSDQPLPGGRRGRRRTTPGRYCNPGSKQISGDQVTHAAERLARSVTILCLLPPRAAADLYADGYSPLGCRWRSDPVNLCRRRLGARDRRFARLYGLLISRSTRRAAIVTLPSVLAERPAYAAVGIIAPWDSGGLRGHLDAAVWVEMSGRIEAASGLPMDGPPPNDHYPKAPGDGCSARVAVSRFACRRTAQSRPTTSGGATTSRRRLCPSGEAALVASS